MYHNPIITNPTAGSSYIMNMVFVPQLKLMIPGSFFLAVYVVAL